MQNVLSILYTTVLADLCKTKKIRKNEFFFVTFCDFRHLYIEVYFHILNEEGVFMDSSGCVAEKKEADKVKLIEFMERNNIAYNLLECCGCDRFCIDLSGEENACKKYCCNSGIIVQTSNKDVCKIYPNEILYIAIEDRKSVLYLTDGKIETNYRLDHWKGVLDLKTFAQPHHSFIVNLNYVDAVTKEWVRVNYSDKEYLVYTSFRKISAFKKAFLNFGKE